MDQDSLVGSWVDAGRKLLAEFDKYKAVKTAVWLKESEDSRWYLYIVCGAIHDRDVRDAYGQVLQIVGKMPEPKLDPFRVRIVAAEDPMAKLIEEFQLRYTGTTPPPWREVGVGAEDAYVYRLPVSTASP